MVIVDRLKTMGRKTGAREQYFKMDEGKPGDGICALYDDADKNLRLYCMRFGNDCIILGGGGFKPKSIRAWQEDPVLSHNAEMMIAVARAVNKRIKERELRLPPGKTDLEGDLEFND